MKILHYIPKTSHGGIIFDDLTTLVAAMKPLADVQVTTKNADAIPILEKGQTDILHIHACWNCKAAQIAKKAHKQGVAVVISPHWQLEPYIRMHEQHITKVVKTALYQYKMIRQADALQVSTEAERKNLIYLGWNKRCDVVRSSLLNSSVTAETMARSMMDFYQKVIDTRYGKLMTTQEFQAIFSLLHVGKEKDARYTSLSNEQILNIRDLNPAQWQRMMLYADDEHIRDVIEAGVTKLALDAPAIDTSQIARFETEMPKSGDALETKRLIQEKKSLKEKLERETQGVDEVIKSICIMLLNMKYHIQKRTLSMRHLADFYEVVKYQDYDEDKLKEVLKYMKLKGLASSIIYLLSETFYLSEGFMPIPPIDNKTTRHIRQMIIH